jgi:UDP-N-acetylglucosamine--N-acetylmuramyl-(pentapeptide) pyrophosphoryl-undecaprenol N-acetylglucosamine transferase
MRIILTGGGTGGHINPAIAIADALCRADDGCEILFVGTERGMENRLVMEAGYPIWHVDVIGIKRSISLENFKALYKALKSTKRAKELIEKFRPDGAVGTGGYVCYPIIKAASSMGIYTALHESNAIPGLAVKTLKNKVDKIFVNFEESGKRLSVGDKVLRTGNPMRRGISPSDRERARLELSITGKYRYVILSFGGSLGAATVNREMLKLMRSFTCKRNDILHIHATGKSGYTDFYKEFCALGLDKYKNIKVSEYIYNMPRWLTAADLVISRSGAMTLSEIAAAGRASILIPSPNVTDNHQYKNAKAFSDAGAAYTVTENERELERLPEIAETILSDKAARENMEKNARGFDYKGAADIIAKEILNGIRKKRRS